MAVGKEDAFDVASTDAANGVQLPIKEVKGDKLVGTEMVYADYKFDTKDGRAEFKAVPWSGLPKPVADQKAKHKYWLNAGPANEVWQAAYHDQYNSFVRDRYPMAYLEINPDDARQLGVSPGDVVEVWNDYGSTHAMAYLRSRLMSVSLEPTAPDSPASLPPVASDLSVRGNKALSGSPSARCSAAQPKQAPRQPNCCSSKVDRGQPTVLAKPAISVMPVMGLREAWPYSPTSVAKAAS